MDSDAILSLTYLTENKENIRFSYDQFFIDDKEYKINEKILAKIQFNDFEKEIGSKIVTIKLIDIDNESTDFSYFEVIPGENYGLLFPGRSGLTRDIIFPDNLLHNIMIKHDKKIIYQKSFSKRLLLINISSDFFISIDNIIVTKSLFTISTDDSSQVIAYNLNYRILFNKPISPINYKKFFDFYDLRKDDAENFVNSIKNLINNTNIKLLQYDILKKEIKYDELMDLFIIKFNLPKAIILRYYNKEEYFNFISNCSLYYIFSNLKDMINNCEIFSSIFKYFEEYKNKIKNDINLNFYHKSIAIMEFSYWLKTMGSIDKFKEINFTYYCCNICEENSPIKSSLLFLEKFIKDLDNGSPFLEPLILIDSGTYIYNNNFAFGYGLASKDILKKHLLNIIPDVLFFYSNKETSNDYALSNKANNAVSINLGSRLFSKYNGLSLNKKIDNDIIRDNLSLRLVFILLQEVFAYKKEEFTIKGDFVNSSNIFFHAEKNNIMSLVNKNSFEKRKNFINIIRDSFKDCGKFLEYFFGEFEYGYISELIEIMMENGVNLHFLFNNNLWHDKIETLQEYTKLKYLVYTFKPELLPDSNFKSIDEEIEEIQKIIKINNIPQNIESKIIHINKPTNSEEIPITIKSNSILSRKYSNNVEYKNYEKLSFDSLQKKLKNPNISEEIKNIIREILFSRIIKH